MRAGRRDAARLAAGGDRVVILGVTASDAHAVANRLIELYLGMHGFTVVNLGPCTPVSDFCLAAAEHPGAEAVIIGSLNGHAVDDLRDLKDARARGLVPCPVILGGNLSVGSSKDGSERPELHDLGVDYILEDPGQLPALLESLQQEVRHAAAV